MGIWDRDWYKEELRRREGLPTNPGIRKKLIAARPTDLIKTLDQPQTAWILTVIVILLMITLAVVVTDMKERGVPFTLHGLRWWLSLWFGSKVN